MNQANTQTVTDPTTVARRAIAARMSIAFDARQQAEAERIRQVQEESRKKAEELAKERAEKAAKEQLECIQLRNLDLFEILQLPKLPRITFTARYFIGTIAADLGIEESYVIGQGNGATVALGLETIAAMTIGMPTGKWSRQSLQNVVDLSARDGKMLSRYTITDTAQRSVKWGEFVDYYGLEFASIDYPAPILDDAVEQDMRRRFTTLLEPANSR